MLRRQMSHLVDEGEREACRTRPGSLDGGAGPELGLGGGAGVEASAECSEVDPWGQVSSGPRTHELGLGTGLSWRETQGPFS